MQINQLMTKFPTCIGMDDSLAKVKNLFEQQQFHHLLVVDNNQLMGVISDRDLLKAIGPNLGTPSETNKDLAILNKHAHLIMTRKPITIEENASVKVAIGIFNEHKISCLPVINHNNKPIGILSWRDIFKAIAN